MGRRAIYSGIAAGVLGAAVGLAPWVLELEETVGLQWLFALRGPLPEPDSVAVVAIAGASADVYGLSSDLDEWPRGLHARLIDRLSAAGAAAIVMDIIFEVPGDAERDRQLAEAIRRSGRVVLLERVRSETVELAGSGGSAEAVYERRIQPIDLFRDGAAATAPFTLPTVPFRVSQFWAFGRSASDTANLPLVALFLYALPVYEEFIVRLADAATAKTSHLPENLAALERSRGWERVVRDIRRIFLDEPGLGSRMADAVAAADLPPRHRELLLALIDAYGGPDSRYLNFHGATGTIETIPYHAILEAPLDALADFDLGGRVVFVGFSERRQAEQQDEFISVYSERSGLNLSGVEIGATAFANLAERNSITTLSISAALLLTFAWGVTLAALLAMLTSQRAVMAAAVMGLVYFLLARRAFDAAQLWLPIVAPLFILLPAVLAATLFLSYRDLSIQRERIQRALGRYVPPQVAKRLAVESFDTGASRELVHGTCLVSDAEQFTQLAESMDPESLHTLMQQYFAVLTGAVERHGGFVADISGDSMVAIWAGSKPDAALRRNACLATLDVLEQIDRFNAMRPGHSLPTGIGLDSGELLLGNIGVAERYQYRAVGDIVSTASRIQGLNRQLGTRALVSAATLDALGGFATRPLGEFLLVGKTHTVFVHQLIYRGSSGSGGPATAVTGELEALFAEALERFRARDWSGARERLRRLLERHPGDGPAQFYLRQCDVLERSALPDGWSGTIRVNVK